MKLRIRKLLPERGSNLTLTMTDGLVYKEIHDPFCFACTLGFCTAKWQNIAGSKKILYLFTSFSKWQSNCIGTLLINFESLIESELIQLY